MSEVLEQTRRAFEAFRADYERVRNEIAKVIVGQEEVIDQTLTALFAGGHVLLEGVPGLGKTLLVRTLAAALHLSFRRVQFTPDLMPADLTGTNVVAETPDGRKTFEFQRGPVFANVVLADEINRATPKTQSALLEAMQEKSVTVAGVTHRLPEPFFVLATQNPLEMEGTYPLPEAQLDRFFFKILVRYPTLEQVEAILDRTTGADEPTVEPVLDGERVLEMMRLVRQVAIADDVRRFAVELTLATHPESEFAPPSAKRYVRYGASPRAAQALVLAGKLRAIRDRRYHVAREDIAAAALPALRHRIILSFEAQAENVSADQVINEILQELRKPAPV